MPISGDVLQAVRRFASGEIRFRLEPSPFAVPDLIRDLLWICPRPRITSGAAKQGERPRIRSGTAKKEWEQPGWVGEREKMAASGTVMRGANRRMGRPEGVKRLTVCGAAA
ncbi:hypothetical protein OA90_21025 [Labrenzia sp. OB1]|nr:hypothetical protein OA90_21025 [Labrenzia sp. OB1]